jgi:hypothetical protein
VLAQALTSANPTASTTTGRTNLLNIGNTRDLNRIPNDTVEYYILLADSEIDGILTQMYFTPFAKCAHGEWLLDEDINVTVTGTGTDGLGTDGLATPTSSTTVVISSSVNLLPGEELIIHDDLTGTEEIVIVSTIVDQYTFTVTSDIEGTFYADNDVRVIRVRFPPPLNQISARYAASFIYDKYFAAQAQPDMSDYGKEMRAVAMGQLNDILNGKVILNCARRRGNRFANANLDDTYQHRDRGYNTSERDMSQPS